MKMFRHDNFTLIIGYIAKLSLSSNIAYGLHNIADRLHNIADGLHNILEK
jgi:hypothetical protein